MLIVSIAFAGQAVAGDVVEAVKGEAPSGPAYEMQQSLMNAKVMLSKAVM